MREQTNIVNMKEQEIVHIATENIPEDIGVNIVWENDPAYDPKGRIRITIDDQEILFNVEIKKELREHQLPKIVITANDYPPLMIIAHYLRPKIKEELRKRNIAYLEKNGNIFFKQKGKFVYIDANKPINLADETGNRAFTATGLKVVFQFLIDDKLVNKTYREIADTTKTALGNVNNIIKSLEKDSFLIKLNKKEKRLQNKKKLLEKWMNAYKDTVQPTIKIGRFRFVNENNFTHWKDLLLDDVTTWWGGEPAGDILTNYLRPAELTLYTTKSRNEIMRDYKLIPDQNGNINVFNAFWNEGKNENTKTVYPLLVYVDLMNTGDSRCYETAQMIWDKYLNNEF
jgi:hypothetical protein